MNPRYSVFICNYSYDEFKETIDKWLLSGIKVIWISKDEKDVEAIHSDYLAFAKAFLLLVYKIDIADKYVIIDGDDKGNIIKNLIAPRIPLFNSAQYLVEHCKSDEHIVVQASAGTGKTTVMIDRIMYLLHTQPGLRLKDIYMITFTNEATDSMNRRLQDVLIKRYQLTGQQKYLRWLEEQSQLNISTIHSFALNMLKKLGISEGFTSELTIKNFKYERSELIKDTIDSRIKEDSTIKKQLGMPFYKAGNLVSDFWGRFHSLGISRDDMNKMDWGGALDDQSKPIQQLMVNVMNELDDKYFEIKRENNAIAVDDIMRDLQEVLSHSELPEIRFEMKYLFIDEFQDSDLSQIKVACQLVKLLQPSLFVVGDVKQSIYRFRGATDKAFETLERDMREMGIKKAKQFSLINNYRTSSVVMDRLDTYFKSWSKDGMLQYDCSVVPFNKFNGRIKMLRSKGKEFREDEIAEIAKNELEALVNKVENSGKEPTDKNRVVMLARTNTQLKQLATILRNNKIPAAMHQDGSFFASEAVRDFYICVSSFMFCDEPKYIFNYLLTPYAGVIDPMDINVMERLNGDYDSLVDYLDHFLNQTNWKKYHKDLRLKPVMSVLKSMIDEESVVDYFIINKKKIRETEGWEEKKNNAATFTEARQYQANLEKLMELLQRNLGGDKVSLYDVYNFLKLNIATNRSETEPEVQSNDDYTSVLCMTVHKSKGLEFDTVVIPYTHKSFKNMDTSEIIISPDKHKVGWRFFEKKNDLVNNDISNSSYSELKSEDDVNTSKEETRILYVAATRAIENLICLVPKSSYPSWAKLIGEVGVDYE